jgi:hypothetical protein
MSITQSSVKHAMIASTSWALKASRNASSNGVADFVLAMDSSPRREAERRRPHAVVQVRRRVGFA